MTTRDEIDQQILRLWGEKKTIRQIAQEIPRSKSTIHRRMTRLGLKPWGEPLARGTKIRCGDGHLVASHGEKAVDEFLTEQGIVHEVHKHLQGTPCRVDFWLPIMRIGIEYAGLKGGLEEYDRQLERKKQQYAQWDIAIVWIYPETSLDATLLQKIIRVTKEAREHKEETIKKLRSRYS